jgi:adenine-specific DNA-methyltransferase
MKKQRLELTWIGKDERPRLEPRILLEDIEKSYHASIRNEGDIFDNRLIFGDNLLAQGARGGIRRQGEMRFHRPALQHG